MNGAHQVAPRTTIVGDVYGPVLSGTFYGPVSVFSAPQYADLRRKLIDIAPILTRVRLDRFVGRGFVTAALDRFLDEYPRGYFRLIGQPGIGKTTFLAHLVRQRGYIHHFVDRSQGITSLAAGLENLSAQVVAACNLEWEQVGLPPEAGRDGAFLAARLVETAEALPGGQKLVLVVDALDEAECPAAGNALCLPSALPDRVYVVVAQRPDHVSLETAPGTPVCPFTLSASGDANLKDVGDYLDIQLARPEIAARLSAATPPVSQASFKETMIERSAGNFMYLDFVLEDIAASATLSLDSLPDGLEGYYEQFWDQLRKMRREDRDLWKEVLRPVICLLAIAREPVSADWLARMGRLDEEDVRMDALEAWLHFLGVQERDGWETYRLFHQSFRDFLDRRLGNLAPVHRAVAENTLASAADGWEACEPYGLRHLLSHLVAVAREGEKEDAGWARGQLGQVLETEPFAKASLAQLERPQELLGPMGAAVTVLLEACELKRAWVAIGRYRDVLQQQRQTEQVFASLRAGRFEHALQRTSFYGERPGFQALLQLLVAWYANRAGERDLGQKAAQMALHRLRGLFGEEGQTDSQYVLRENWQRLLIEVLFRVARVAGPSWLEHLSPGEDGLVGQVYARASTRLSQPPKPSEAGFSSGPAMESLLNRLEAKLREDHPTTYREAAMQYRKELAHGLSAAYGDPRWYEYVERSVTLIALDDYPSYRELALVVIALPIAQHPKDGWAMAGLEVLLKAALEASEPHFTQDLPIALLQVRPDRWADLQDGLNMAHQLTYTTTSQMAEEPAPYTGHVWGGTFRSDPWAREILRCSAIAAVQHRLGWHEESRRTLREAARLDHRSNYAGYRALAHLALACRWVELGDRKAARRETAEAYWRAGLMYEEALGRQRQALARQIRRWVKDEEPTPSLDQAWQQLGQLGELEQGWTIRLLSARCMGDARRLRELVPFALDNATVLDAVLGRLVGTLASAGACLPALGSLSEELEIGQEG